MQNHQVPHRVVATKAKGTGPVTRAHVNVRAHQLAEIAGRVPPHVAQVDYEQAKREVTGESDLNRQESMLDSNPEQA